MDTWLIMQCGLLVFLLLASAFMSGSEMALFSLSKLQVRRLRQAHPVSGKVIGELLEQPHRLLSTILLGNTVVNVMVALVGYQILREVWPARAEVVAVPLVTLMLLVFGEVTPKVSVIRNPMFFALYVAVPLQWLCRFTAPLRSVAEGASAWLVKRVERLPFFSRRQVRTTAPTEDEYRTLLRASEKAGVLHRDERDMVNRILSLERTLVKDIMTPRVDMQCVEDTWPAEQIAADLRCIKHRRVPVIHDTPDQVEGILNAKDFLTNPQRPLREMLIKPLYVPETMSAARLLQEFRKLEQPAAIVVDEYGGTFGLVTLEDVLEEIVGEIEDEFDTSEIMVQQVGPRRFLVNGKARLDLVNEQCGLSLQSAEVGTIAGWVIAQIGSLPREGDRVRRDGVQVTVNKMIRHRIREVMLEVERRS
jgi:putative hemolysin